MTLPALILWSSLAISPAPAAEPPDHLHLAADVLSWTHAGAMLTHQVDHLMRGNTNLPFFWPLWAAPVLQGGLQVWGAGPLVWIPFDLLMLFLDVTAHYFETEIDPTARIYRAWERGDNAAHLHSPVAGRVAQTVLGISVASAALHLVLQIVEGVRHGFTLKRDSARAGLAPVAVGIVPMSRGAAASLRVRF